MSTSFKDEQIQWKYKLLGTDQDQVGIAVTTDTILEQPARQGSDGAEGNVGRLESDTPEHKWSNVKTLLD